MRNRMSVRPGIGDRCASGMVGYAGAPHAPHPLTYAGVDVRTLAYTTVEDSGRHPRRGAGLANLYPLIAAALYEVAFAREAGPLSTWSN